MKKNIFIILTIFLIILMTICYFLYDNQRKIVEATKVNKDYNTYYEQTILGTDLISIINKTIDINERNKVEKNEKNVYIENDTNSIKIYIKFLESDETFLMEAINNKGFEAFVKNFAASSFKCTSIEYHEKTNFVKSLVFEQV